MSYKPLLLVTAPVQTRSGYGAHARDIVRSLIDIDKFDIKIDQLPFHAIDCTAVAFALLADQHCIIFNHIQTKCRRIISVAYRCVL